MKLFIFLLFMFFINTLSTTNIFNGTNLKRKYLKAFNSFKKGISCKATNGIIPSIIPLRKSKSERKIYQGENEQENSGKNIKVGTIRNIMPALFSDRAQKFLIINKYYLRF
uniref:Uncharacterized protein n=1 Tax=Meloidogyne enterolobii TaxID=390850 RepID=A0A6V7X625_MELEN|nr:unnamed protein product [Meloidogyne enterolobii]